ncbi:hypothetical protein EDC54_102250 [Samsonia erythrinae]|uniref:Uncharacterized protein n=1 Tax=Samsonia erythrinae TaxID=160434 RepID=A0A4R3VQA4_9GAMM|nr:hypothetical protein EDC54_102250 [Samsonia erythrinae]
MISIFCRLIVALIVELMRAFCCGPAKQMARGLFGLGEFYIQIDGLSVKKTR